MDDRRRDLRTSKPFSLSNLLKQRADENGWILAVVGNEEGLVMGSSRDRTDKQAARIAAHASAEMFAGARNGRFACAAPSMPDVHLVAIRFDVGERRAFLAILAVGAATASAPEQLVASVSRILAEPTRSSTARVTGLAA